MMHYKIFKESQVLLQKQVAFYFKYISNIFYFTANAVKIKYISNMETCLTLSSQYRKFVIIL